MSYTYDLVFFEIKKALLHAPNSSLKEIERRLGIERHTLKRVVRSVARKTFREFHRGRAVIEGKRTYGGGACTKFEGNLLRAWV